MARPAIVATLLLLAACATSPLGRNQLILFPDAEIAQMGAATFQSLKQGTPPLRDARRNAYVSCVAQHLLRASGHQPQAWEVLVFADESANAFALPGRKIGVHSGLLDVARNQHQLATVIGHEIAHVTARHANERVSNQFVTQTGMELVQAASGETTPMKQQLFALLGVGVQVGVTLPFGRTQEAEADVVGLDLMANAGFEPSESVNLWRNMTRAGGQKPPEFLSTHPSNERRIAELSARVPEASRKAAAARQSGRRPDCRS